MVGWKRIVVAVGEKIGKEHLTYAQGASAELVEMACGWLWLAGFQPHVLSSGDTLTMMATMSGERDRAFTARDFLLTATG